MFRRHDSGGEGFYGLAERMLRLHERWLNHALRSRRRYPRIPTRRADRGGFEDLANVPGGRQWADEWWHEALQHVD